MNSPELELNDRVRVILGSGLMILSSLFAVLIFCDRMDMRPFEFPATWYSTRPFHLLLCGAMFFCAAITLRSPAHHRTGHARPVFSSCRLFTRKHCPLCDDAIAVLAGFQGALPSIEVIDIDDSRELMRQFGESVPVVEIDGKVRFRGGVNAHLLRRLINAAERRAEVAGSETDARGRGIVDPAL
jgi:glutaredoxin